MGKFNITAGSGGGLSGLIEGATVDLPTGPVKEEVAEQAPPAGGNALSRLAQAAEQLPAAVGSAETAPAIGEAVSAGLEAQAAREGELEAQRQAGEIAPIGERLREDRVDTWLEEKDAGNYLEPDPDGNIFQRANAMGAALESGSIRPRLGSESQRAGRAAADNVAPLVAAAEQSGAILNNTLDPDFGKVGSVVTENFIAELGSGTQDAEGSEGALQEALGETSEVEFEPDSHERPKFTKAAQNERLGQQIHAEYSRLKNRREGRNPDEYQALPKEAALTLGDAFKEMYAAQNPRMIKRFQGKDGDQSYFQLTGFGANRLEQSAQARKQMFPTQHVRPSKSIPARGAEVKGDVQRSIKPWVGQVGDHNGRKVINRAMDNMSTIPNVVDKTRAKILFGTILPVLAAGGNVDPNDPVLGTFAEINNIGASKDRKYAAAKKDQDRRRAKAAAKGEPFREKDYDPVDTKAKLVRKVAQEVRAVAQERNGANYLTYSAAAFNGRISPQESFFDPTTSKAVRFVTRNAVPAKAKKGNRQWRNLQQMYAMMLVPGADSKLPNERVNSLNAATPDLLQKGRRLKEIFGAVSDAEYEAVAAAIEAGTPLTDPSFPQVSPLAFDPNRDADLLKAIKDKGEDGPHYIDGLMDFVDFHQHIKDGREYHSYFNAYTDGKTNGLASNGLQMGHEPTARATGVLRESKTDLLDDGDIRDQLKSMLLEDINEGFTAVSSDLDVPLTDVAQAVFSWRDLNKATTMTFGYGKEIESFKKNLDSTISELHEIALSDDVELIEKHGLGSFAGSMEALAEMDRDEMVETLLNKYSAGLENALSADAIQSRSIMRSAAFLLAMTDKEFKIQSPTGLDLNLGRNVSEGWEAAKEKGKIHKYGLELGGQKTGDIQVAEYDLTPTAAAARTRVDKHGVPQNIPGEYAHGGSLPGPVQSIDAATVAATVTGDSWKRLNAASGGNPYIHTIYDAFKSDANGFDVIMEESNKNWFEAATQWSYLEQTNDTLKRELKDFMADASANPTAKVSPAANEFMNWWLAAPEGDYGPFPKNLANKLRSLLTRPDGMDADDWRKLTNRKAKVIWEGMVKSGWKEGNATKRDQQVFFMMMRNELMLSDRLGKMINKTNKQKAELVKKIKAQAPKPEQGLNLSYGLQYYAH